MSTRLPATSLERLFPGDSEMAGRMRAIDWSATALGPPEDWPVDMQVAVRLCLTSGIAVVMFLGPELSMLYNDEYIPFLGETKHPRDLGRPARECWSEIWATLGPMADSVYASGRATRTSDFLMYFNRLLPREEVYVRFTYGPIFDVDGGKVIGIFCPCTETTEQVVGARRLETLRKLGMRSAEARTVDAACRAAVAVLCENVRDIPFAAIYVVDSTGEQATLSAKVILGDAHQLPPAVCAGDDSRSPWPIAEVLKSRRAKGLVDFAAAGIRISGAEWPEPIERAMLLPIAATTDRLSGILVVGVSPRGPLNADYRTFLDLVRGHVAIAISEAQAYAAERERAEKLAELDRAKTTFFTNISHEFRTPLTLILGPLEDALGNVSTAGEEALVANLKSAHRNATRLLKLVNALLDFSRIEAGRMEARYEPIDLSALTLDLASVFRSAIESAGLRFRVRCDRLPQPVYVDRDMWEKIVLNLLSNAFKFTFEGGIELDLGPSGDHVEMVVRDSGIGIAPKELPRVFERFHRIEGARARTHEGSGIGLALVQDLVRMHKGEISARSELDKGTSITVSIPLGYAHLPSERIGSSETRLRNPATTAAFATEVERWSPATESERLTGPAATARILVADDNADMREYLTRLLCQRWTVEAVADGEAALAAARRSRFDLVLTDVMMPCLDGFVLLKALRADPSLESIPVILLSARAGEESRIEGLKTGADDYLIKPFSAAEVLARVELHLKKARADSALRLSLVEQQALMKEVHHRVKNNLEVVNSLLSLQADFVDNRQARQVLVETANRIRVIADIHRLLYQTPKVAQLDLAAFVDRLATSLLSLYAEAAARVRLDLLAEPVEIDLQRAVPIGLILNELFSNALKHAFVGNRGGTIRVRIDATGLEFSDDGIGLPASIDPCNSPSLGLQLVQVLVRQIGGTLKVESGPGTRINLRFSSLRSAIES